MQFLPDLLALLQPFAFEMSEPTFANLIWIFSGWILSRRHTVAAGLTAEGPLDKHFSTYFRVFSKSVWNVDAVGLRLAGLMLGLSEVVPGARVCLIIDDTLCKKKGRLPFGVGMHYDASATGRGLSNSHGSYKANGHCWVVLGLGLELNFRPGHTWCLPVLARLYHNHKSVKRHKVTYKTKVQLAGEMLKLISESFAQRQFDLLVDSAYAGKNMLNTLPSNCQLTARWILNAALYQPATASSKRGRPRVHGQRSEGVEKIITGPPQRIELDVYGKHQVLQVWQTTACFYASPHRLLKIVVTRSIDAQGRPDPKSLGVLFTTNTQLTAGQVIKLYARRWAIEVTIHDAKQQLGIAQPQVWCRKSVERAVPTLLLTYSIVIAWFGTVGHRHWRPTILPWYRHKTQASFADILGHLRIQLLNKELNGIFKDHRKQPVTQKELSRVALLIKQAA